MTSQNKALIFNSKKKKIFMIRKDLNICDPVLQAFAI